MKTGQQSKELSIGILMKDEDDRSQLPEIRLQHDTLPQGYRKSNRQIQIVKRHLPRGARKNEPE